jgi:hypothetical protein
VEPESVQNDQETTLKKGNMKVPFTGMEVFYAPGDPGETTVFPNGKTLVRGTSATWLDVNSTPLASGLTLWTFNVLWDGTPYASSGKYWGKGEMTVMTITTDQDGKYVPLFDNRGTWDIPFHGDITLEGGVLKFTAYSTGIGKSGEVKRLVFHAVSTLDFSKPDDVYGPFYKVEGYYIDKNKCHNPHGRRNRHGRF